jgi:hypothetical protein
MMVGERGADLVLEEAERAMARGRNQVSKNTRKSQ